MNEFIVVGIGFYTSKNGKEYRILNLSQAYNDAKYGVGAKVSQEFLSKQYIPEGLNVGDTVSLCYGRSFKGEAYVNGVSIVKEEIPTIQTK